MALGMPMSELIVHPDKHERFRFALPPREITLGRLPANDLCVQDSCCSGRHAAIAPKDGEFVVRDLGSKNGTSVNGVRLTGEKVLRKGDEIKVGNSKIWFEEYRTEVILTPKTDLTRSSNTIIQVKEVIQKHRPPSGVHRPSGRGPAPADTGPDQRISRVLKKVGEALVLHMDVDSLCEYIMDLIAREIPMDRGVLMLKSDGDGFEKKTVRIFNEPAKPHSIQISRSIVQKTVEGNVAILVSSIQDNPDWQNNESVIQKAIRSAMCVPLWDNSGNVERIIGVIYADRRTIPAPFTQVELDILALLANMAAVKISEARHIEEEEKNKARQKQLILARQIQMNLLPKKDPSFEPFDISGTMRVCYEVGGDYFDYIPLGTGLGVVIADVSGKGYSAALHMTQLRGYLHASAAGAHDLGELAGALNKFVHSSSESNIFISFFLGLVDRDKGEMTYVNAGHNPPLLLKANGGLMRLGGTGFCLGMFPAAEFGTETVPFEPGDILCAYTDGITESRNPEEQEYGEERLAALVREAAGLPSGVIKEKILESVGGFSSSSEAFDDMTLVVIKRAGEESSAGNEEGRLADFKELSVKADIAEIDGVRDFLKENIKDLALSEEDALNLELSLHEICVNIAMYAYPEENGEMTIRIWREGDAVYFETRDRGVPFDPATSPEPDIKENVRKGKRGGLGIFLYRKLMDGYSYRREGDENVLTVFKKIAAA
jgi:serine phosphatase RsbU (regulator of sigma subunit)/anti-sigma regulatory factor (Ser/Thr protein kinase)/pSer/pThr/pTyr-binding forkhead associated (FHA) protein